MNHPLTVHLSPTSTANIVVSSLEPKPASTSAFVKIAPNAEVIVAPKERTKASLQPGKDIHSRRSADGRSAASTTRTRSRHAESIERPPVLRRGIARRLARQWFDEEEEEDRDSGLRVWVDPSLLTSRELKEADFVSVSIVRPSGYQAPTPQGQSSGENQADVKPSTRLIARLVPWEEAPNSRHVVLSSMICEALDSTDMVGDVIQLQAAAPKLAGSTVRSLKVLPFIFQDSGKTGLQFGGKSRGEREAAVKAIVGMYSTAGQGNGLFGGPLTNGMILPPADTAKYGYFDGAILKLEYAPDVSTEVNKAARGWILGSDRHIIAKVSDEKGWEEEEEEDRSTDTTITSSKKLTVEIGAEIAKPPPAARLWTIGDVLPDQAPSMVGIDPLIAQLTSHIQHGSSVLLAGGRGSGKTSLTQLLALRLREEEFYHTTYFPCRKLASEDASISTIKESLTRMFGLAAWGARFGGHALIVMEDIDSLCPTETELQVGGENGRSRHISELIIGMVRQHCSSGSRVILLATAKSKEEVNNVIIGGHVVREIVSLPAPDKETRRKVLEAITKGTEHSLDDDDDDQHIDPAVPNGSQEGFSIDPTIDFLDLAGQTDGYMPGDLRLLISRARSECIIRSISSSSNPSHLTLTTTDFTSALAGFTPTSLRNVTLQHSTTRFNSIGGLHATRQTLLETLQYPTLYSPIFSRCPLRLRSGLLLYGYPGCGKTLLASAVAGECGLNFISVKGPEILNKYIGASEKSVRDLFERAQAARPCVLFFDEFDSVAPKRGHDSTGVTDRVVNQLLTQMDGAEGLSGVYVLAATSRPDLIDPALLRPGRLDKSLLCDMPGAEEREDILRALIRGKLRVDERVLGEGEEETLKEVARRTEGYSGADLQAVVYNAHLEAIHDVLGDRNVPSKPRALHDAVGGDGETKEETTGSGSGSGSEDFTYFRLADITSDGTDDPLRNTQTAASRAAERARIAALLSSYRSQHQHQHNHANTSSSNSTSSTNKSSLSSSAGAAGAPPSSQEPVITWPHILRSLAQTRPSVSGEERRRLAGIYKEFVVGRNGEMPRGGEEGGREVGGRTSLM